jgi:outer membrane biosynthesis protein TonB
MSWYVLSRVFHCHHANNFQFLHSGRFLKEEQAGGGTGRMRQQLQKVVPHATERFHDALDELQNEIRLAQTVLRRDMALLKQDRKKKEAAAKQQEAEKARLAAEAKNVPAPVEEAPVKVEKVATPAPPEPTVSQPQEAPEAASAKEPEVEEVPKKEDDAKAPPPPPIETDIEPPKDPLFDGTPTTGNAQESEFDFDAMFGDAMDTSGDNPHNDMMDTSGDMDFTLDDGNDGPSLLRGLEDFAKDSDDDANQASNSDIDFTMPDLPGLDMTADANANTNDNATAAKPAEPEPEPAPKAEEPKPAEQPAVEEKKEEEPTTAVDDEMMDTMTTDNLEDLFNMEEYENPEQSQFDDAFFNFE